jgi:hypothetical protein
MYIMEGIGFTQKYVGFLLAGELSPEHVSGVNLMSRS